MPADGKPHVGYIGAGVVNMQPATVAQLEITFVHHSVDLT
jgi:hypothetical protein